MDIARDKKYVGSENESGVYTGGKVFPAFGDIEIDCDVTCDVSHIFPNFKDRRAEGTDSSTTVPLIVLGTEIADSKTKFEDDLSQHTFPKTNLIPPMTCLSGFDDNDFVFNVVDLVSDLMSKDLLDLIDCDISEQPAVVHYSTVLQNKDTYKPEARPGATVNKSLNDFITRNMIGEEVNTVLDLGAGKGTSLTRLERLGRISENTVVDCVEPNEELAKLCSATVLHSGAEFSVQNCTASEFFQRERIGVGGKVYDLVVANNSIHFICDEDDDALTQIHRSLAPNGSFIGTFPNYDSLVFRPFYGSSVAGLVRAHYEEDQMRMETDIAGVRRSEPTFPFWKLMNDMWDVSFAIGSGENVKEKEVISCFSTFSARKRVHPKKHAFECVEHVRTIQGDKEFVRPGFRACNRGKEVRLEKVSEVDFPTAYLSKGKAVSWCDFFAIRSGTMLVTSKTNGVPGHLSYVGGRWIVRSMGNCYAIEGDYPCVQGVFQVELKCSKGKWRIVLTEDQSSPLFINQFGRDYPSFLWLKDYFSIIDVENVLKLLHSEKEGIVIQGCFSTTAFLHDTINLLYVKWDPTVDLLCEGKVKEYFLDGRFNRERGDKSEGNSLDAIASILTDMTPLSFAAVLHLPMDISSFDMPHKNLVSYPFGTENFVERNSFVGIYNKGLFEGARFQFPRALLEQVVHGWDPGLWKSVLKAQIAQ